MTRRTLTKTSILAVLVGASGKINSQTTTSPGGHGCYAVQSLEASQTNNPNSGIRRSSRNLKMVKPDDGNAAANILANGSGFKKSNLPTWSGGDGLEASAGDLTASWKGNTSDLVNARGDCPSNNSAEVSLTILDPLTQNISFTKESTGVKEFEEKITEWLTRFGKKPIWSSGGSITGEARRCDFHNNGERTGYKASVTGALHVKAPQIEGETPGVPVMGGIVFVAGQAKFNPFTVEASGSFTYNQEKADPWEDPFEGSVKIETGGSLGLKASAGNEKIAEVYAKGDVAISLTGNGNFDVVDRDIRLASAKANFGELTLNAEVGAKALGSIEWKLWSGSLTLWEGANYDVPGLPRIIYTIPE